MKGIILTTLIVLVLSLGSWSCHREELADLVIENIGLFPVHTGHGDKVFIKAIIKNNGAMEAGPSVAAIRIGKEVEPQHFNIPALPPRRSHIIRRLEIFRYQHDYRITVYADFKGSVTESDEQNEKTAHFSVK